MSKSISRRSRKITALKSQDIICIRHRLGDGIDGITCDASEAWSWLENSIKPKIWVLNETSYCIEICNELSYDLRVVS